jgi:hypothetical protein
MFFILANYLQNSIFWRGQLTLQKTKKEVNHLKLPKSGIKLFLGGKMLPHVCVLITILGVL